MNYQKDKEKYISYCGAYCHLCDWFTGRHRKVFQTATDSLELYGFKRVLKDKVDIKNLKLGLKILANSGICSAVKLKRVSQMTVAKFDNVPMQRVIVNMFLNGFRGF